jgi:hypothetical protein
VAKALKTYPPLGLLNYADVRLPVVEPAPEAGAGGAAASGPGKLAKGCTPIA